MAEHTSTFKGFDFEKPLLDLEEQIQALEKTAQANEGVDLGGAIRALQNNSLKDAVSAVADLSQRPRRDVYARALELTKTGRDA